MTDITLSPPTEPDVYSYGFDTSLNRVASDTTIQGDTDMGQTLARDLSFSNIVTGTGNSLIIVDPSKGLWIGNAQFSSAPFSVSMNGDLTANSVTIAGVVLTTKGTFGGDGSDGALDVTSGTTTINLGGAAAVVKQYSSINVSSGATLTFSNPAAGGTTVTLKSQGAVTIAGTINGSGLGASGGATDADGTASATIVDDAGTHQGTKGTASASIPTNNGTVLLLKNLYASSTELISGRSLRLVPGSGAGGGGSGNLGNNGGAGGAGGIALFIECKGALNGTGTVDVSGATGSNGTNGGASTAGGGGGGGAGGSFCLLYNTLTANSLTIQVVGGNGGNGGTSTDVTGGHLGGQGGGGAGGYSGVGGAGGRGGSGGVSNAGAGSNSTTSTGGSAGTTPQKASGGGGGGGADGWSLVAQNTIYA